VLPSHYKFSFSSLFSDEVKFGEVVQAPPSLSAKPRGSRPRKRGQEGGTTTSLPVLGFKEKHDLVEERLKIISKYRLMKKQKKDQTSASIQT